MMLGAPTVKSVSKTVARWVVEMTAHARAVRFVSMINVEQDVEMMLGAQMVKSVSKTVARRVVEMTAHARAVRFASMINVKQDAVMTLAAPESWCA